MPSSSESSFTGRGDQEGAGAAVVEGYAGPADGGAGEAEAAARVRAAGPLSGPLLSTSRPLPFRLPAAAADVDAGDPVQTLRILRDATVEEPLAGLDDARPRLDRARAWTETLPAEERTQVRGEPDVERLDQVQRGALELLLDGLDEHRSLPGLTSLVYGIPKLQAGLPLDASATSELKVVQRELVVLLYELLVGRDTGPRLPTLLLALGPDRPRSLLTLACRSDP
ncbi:hypothetical protein ACFV4P_22690 [Kitasatospora sp. NPDC059795]|uniref:hypothetical protein n=1 Tax=Kitasatospora sp. NPDC059795 TaxID=3346949 RepID=UPI00364E7C24